MLTFLFFWVGLAVIIGVAAGKRGRSGLGWFLLSIVISPLLAGLLLIAVGGKRPQQSPQQLGNHLDWRTIDWAQNATVAEKKAAASKPASARANAIFAVIAGVFAAIISVLMVLVLAPDNSSQPSEKQPTKEVTTEVVLPPEQDFLTAMGRVYERDMYHLGEQLKHLGNHPKMAPVETDPNLTAEQVFYPNSKAPQVNYLFDVSDKGPPMDARKLSNSETLRLWGLLRIHSMASLVLYKQRCGYPSSTELRLIEDQFDRLPEEYRIKALEHEAKAVEARPPYDNDKDQIHIPGGWQWFCGLVHDSLAEHNYDHMFKTAVEMK